MKLLAGPFLKSAGFTLVELLVSIAVLVLLITLVTQLVNGASSIIGLSDKHMDADTEARLLFNRMSVDIARLVKRPDVDYGAFKQPAGTLDAQYGTGNSAQVPTNLQAGNDQMAFYSQADGYFSGASQPSPSQRAPLSLVAYTVDNDPYTGQPALRRLGKGLGWEPSSGNWADVVFLPVTFPTAWPQLFATGANADADYKTVGIQVVRFEYTYLLKPTTATAAAVMQGSAPVAPLFITPYDKLASPPHTSIDGFQDVAAIVVAIVVVDATSRKIITNYGALTGTTLFGDAKDCSGDTVYHGDLASAWNAQVNSPTFAASAGIPKPAAAGVHVYERYFYLNGQN